MCIVGAKYELWDPVEILPLLQAVVGVQGGRGREVQISAASVVCVGVWEVQEAKQRNSDYSGYCTNIPIKLYLPRAAFRVQIDRSIEFVGEKLTQ